MTGPIMRSSRSPSRSGRGPGLETPAWTSPGQASAPATARGEPGHVFTGGPKRGHPTVSRSQTSAFVAVASRHRSLRSRSSHVASPSAVAGASVCASSWRRSERTPPPSLALGPPSPGHYRRSAQSAMSTRRGVHFVEPKRALRSAPCRRRMAIRTAASVRVSDPELLRLP